MLQEVGYTFPTSSCTCREGARRDGEALGAFCETHNGDTTRQPQSHNGHVLHRRLTPRGR
jgi:hypothetical protein